MHKTLISIVMAVWIFSGCSGHAYKWAKSNFSDDQYYMDDAKCQLVAKEQSSNTRPINSGSETYNTYGHYDRNTGNYSETTSKDWSHSFDPFFNSLAKGASRNESYELCMKSLGYRKVESKPSKSSNSDLVKIRKKDTGEVYYISKKYANYTIYENKESGKLFPVTSYCNGGICKTRYVNDEKFSLKTGCEIGELFWIKKSTFKKIKSKDDLKYQTSLNNAGCLQSIPAIKQ